MSGLFYISPKEKKNKGKIKNKATFLKIYTVLDFTHEPETIHWETFLWIFGKYFQVATKNKEHQIKLQIGLCLCGTIFEPRGNFGVLLITRAES